MAHSALVNTWLEKLNSGFSDQNFVGIAALFCEESFWRDLLAFTWNIKTMEGRDAIAGMLAQAPQARFTIDDDAFLEDDCVCAWLVFETDMGRGKAHVRLKNGLAYTLMTSLEELKGFEEKAGATRDIGVKHGASRSRENWLEKSNVTRKHLAAKFSPIA